MWRAGGIAGGKRRQSLINSKVDVLVIGGGPASAVAATMTRQLNLTMVQASEIEPATVL